MRRTTSRTRPRTRRTSPSRCAPSAPEAATGGSTPPSTRPRTATTPPRPRTRWRSRTTRRTVSPRRGFLGQSTRLEGGRLVVGVEERTGDADAAGEHLELGAVEGLGDVGDLPGPVHEEERGHGHEAEGLRHRVGVGFQADGDRETHRRHEVSRRLRVVLEDEPHPVGFSRAPVDAVEVGDRLARRLAVAVAEEEEGPAIRPRFGEGVARSVEAGECHGREGTFPANPGRHQAATKSATTRFGMTPASCPRSRKAWTALRPRSPDSTVMSLTHIP